MVDISSMYKCEAICRDKEFFPGQQGFHPLMQNILSSHHANSWLACLVYCFHEDHCVSFNYRNDDAPQNTNCQLSNDTKPSTRNGVGNWTFYKGKVDNCLSKPCLNGGSCVLVSSQLKNFQCFCQNGYEGTFCENEAGKVDSCISSPCLNGGTCTSLTDQSESVRCWCPNGYEGNFCEIQTAFPSCRDALNKNSALLDGAYNILTDTNIGNHYVYCQMTSLPGCSGGGWTMVMKLNGSKATFRYESSYWSDKNGYNRRDGTTAFDDYESKLPTYWSTPFNEICVGMKVGNELNFITINYSGRSLRHVIADDKHQPTGTSRSNWKSLINNSSLQSECESEGFNVVPVEQKDSNYFSPLVRLGIAGDVSVNTTCMSPDSFIGFGASGNITCGNYASWSSDNGDRAVAAMGYILVR